MPSKEQTPNNEKTSAKQKLQNSETGDLDILAQPPTHPILIQRARVASRALSPREVLQLQRTIGNRAIGKLLAETQPHQEQYETIKKVEQSPIVQRKRNIAAISEAEFKKHAEDRGDEAKDTDTLATVEANYERSLKTGKSVRTEGLKWYQGAADKKPAISSTTTKERVEAAGYKYLWFFTGEDKVTVCMIRGEDFKDLKSQEVKGYKFKPYFEDDQDYLYANTFNVRTGEFHASINYKNRDQEIADEEKLPPPLANSEIIWFQHLLAQEKAKEKFKDKQVSGLNSISREQIGNTQTLDTIFLSDHGGEIIDGGGYTLDDPTQDDAWALLGTPNGNSAVWALIQHAESGTRDIASITYTRNGLVIRYLSKG